MNAERLLAHYDRIADAPDAIPRLRRFILDLAIRGKLVEQEPGDEPASELLKRIAAAKARLVTAGEAKQQKLLPRVSEDELSIGLPTGWAAARLADLAVCLDYKRKPINSAERKKRIEGKTQDQLYPYFGATQQQGWIDDYLFDEELLLLGEDGVPFFDALKKKSYLVSGKTWVNNHAHVFRGLLVSNAFLAHYLNIFDYTGRVAGATRTKLNQSRAVDIPVPLPPLAEQRRIVAKVDELMALCDRQEAARTERESKRDRLAAAAFARLSAPDPDPVVFQRHAAAALDNFTPLTTRSDQIKVLRQTILNLAVRGKLVEQDLNDEPASELLRRIAADKARLADGFSSGRRRSGRHERNEALEFTLPGGWALSTLGAVSLKVTDGVHQTPIYVSSGVPFVSVKDFSSGRLDLTNTRFITKNEHSLLYKRCDPRRGDILIGRIGTLGRAVLVDTDDEFSLFVSVGLIRFNHENVVPEFLRTLLNSPLVEAEFDRIKIGGGTHTNKLNLGDLRTVALPIPPLAEQHRIVAQVDELMALCAKIEASLAADDNTRCCLLEALLREVLESTADGEAAV